MADYSPSKNDLDSVFKRLRAIPANKVCFDCNAKNPSWATVTYGVFICLDCSAVHRSLGVHLSFVKSSQLDSNWTVAQLRNMQLGGNANAETFFRQHNCHTTDAQQKYNSRAAQLYREKLNHSSKASIKLHRNSLIIDTHHHEIEKEDKKEIDFFEEHSSALSRSPESIAPSIPKIKNGIQEDGIGPNVEAALSSSPFEIVTVVRKSTIGQRNLQSKTKKVGGLGAQRVKKDFALIEKEAAKWDQVKKEANEVKPSKEDQEESFVSLQQTYEKLGLASKNAEEKLKKTDPKKAAQAERLGMGFGARSVVSHSLFEDVKPIKQEPPTRKNNKSTFYSMRDSDIEDEFFSDEESGIDNVIRFNSGPPKYKDSPFEDKEYSKPRGIDDLLSGNKSLSSNWEEEFEKVEKPQSSFLREKQPVSVSAHYKFKPVEDGNAQAKFGNAKAISSDMMFGKNNTDDEMRNNLSRFEGSSSISSADLFGETHKKPSQSIQTPDLDDVKESVRLGVTKVAGKLSNMATNAMASLQDRYA